ncbi:S41 family peptidase [Gramella sp. AN32]|uniref:S41 family peptidase n=1 Tax=Christiangramia antarctica TaxID=2058158 RepID=A0ABW5X5W9_9FLAO|nr:S41 family peptidase [Gramella sp. AN32]
MQLIKKWIPVIILGFLLASCEKDEESLNTNSNFTEEQQNENTSGVDPAIAIEDFIYRGLNDIYLYKAEVPELTDNYFSNDNEKYDFLAGHNSPEKLFNALKYEDDRFSFLTDNYSDLENSFQGISGSTGIKYGIGQISGTNNVFGYLRYVLPGTSAAEAGLTRGTVFTEVNGTQLTSSNFNNLLNADSFTINIGKIEDNRIYMTEKTVTLTDDPYTSNPILLAKTFEMGGKKIGYLMYTSFISDFDDELNTAFGDFKANGITDFILDLRYNGGGSVVSAIDLASMITGQFEGKVFMKEQWNQDYQSYLERQDPESIINRFDSKIRNGATINSLNLNKIYVLTSPSSASASELVINGLDPYIDIIQIGTNTVGKFQASVTLYDSPNFKKQNVNPNHKYAVQPLVFKSINSAGRTDYVNGLAPDIEYREDLNNLGMLGDENEPLLQLALNDILGRAQRSQELLSNGKGDKFMLLGESGMKGFNFQEMYIDEVPELQ